MSAAIKPQLKVLGSDVGIGDWIAVNDHGVMKRGKVNFLQPDRYQWRMAELQDAYGTKHHVTINDHQAYALFTFSGDADGERYDDELIHMVRGIGRNMAQRYARMEVEKIRQRSDYKFTARDGRLVFEDGSSLLLKGDGTRTVLNSIGDRMAWPMLSNWR